MARRPRQPAPQLLLVGGMDVVAFADVHRDGQARARILRRHPALDVAHLGPAAFAGLRGRGPVAGKLHDQQRQVRAEARTEIAAQPFQQGAVVAGIAGVRLALVPQRTAEAVVAERRDHAVVERAEAGGGLPRQVRRRAVRRRHHPVLPVLQRDAAAVRQLQRAAGCRPLQAVVAIGAEHVHRDQVHALVQHAGRHLVVALHAAVGGADPVPVDPGLVDLVGQQVQYGALRGLRLVQLHRGAVPQHAGETGQRRDAPVLPGAVLQRRALPAGFAQARRVPRRVGLAGTGTAQPPGLPFAVPLLLGARPILRIEREQVQPLVVAADLAQRLRAHPRLDARAAPGGHHHAHRHRHRLLQLPRVVVAGGGEIRHVGRRGRQPVVRARDFRLRGGAGDVVHGEHAQAVVRRIPDLGIQVQRAPHLQHHVGLARAQPHVADQQVADGLRGAVRGARGERVRTARG